MKKIFTLVIAVGMFAVAQAQPGQRGNQQNDQRGYQQKDQKGFNSQPTKANDVVIYNNTSVDRYNDKFASVEKKKQMEIAQINKEYDMKIQKVQRAFYLNRFAKQRQIQSLEQQRQREISAVNAKYAYSRNTYNDHDSHSNGRF